ncbi:putative F-box protein At1g67623 [Andrographis paniculata]|uniref:putative F-box protein At1g67623 n=1 Tax=Andrographis paniculata TaxID=175694 RepID=UPI0021E8265B|nr:putative F-box protein At1g67623 [Andrographis paniculata]
MRRMLFKYTKFAALPDELIIDILGRVAASSLVDFFNAKLSCKILNQIGEDGYIYQRANLEKIPTANWKPMSHGQKAFLSKCKKYKNPEIMFRKAVVAYFKETDIVSCTVNLNKALKLGHFGAIYFTALVIIFIGEDQLKHKGIELMGKLKRCSNLNEKMP